MKDQELPDHEEKYRDDSTEDDETAYFDEDPEQPGPSVAGGGRGDHTHVDEAAYMGEEPEMVDGPEEAERKEREEGAEHEAEDRPPAPGVPNFWASTELDDDEDWVPPTRNRPSSSPWEERGKLEEAE